MKELIEALERLINANVNNQGESVMQVIEDAQKALQKAKQKEAIEESTNWQMKAEQPELSSDELFNVSDLKSFIEWKNRQNKDYLGGELMYNIKGHHELLNEVDLFYYWLERKS